MFQNILHKPVEGIAQMQIFILRIGCNWLISVKTSTKCNFTCKKRTDSNKGSINCLGNSHRFGAKNILNIFQRSHKRIVFFSLGCWNEVRFSGKHLSYRTYRNRNSFDTINDCTIFVTENNIRMFSHQFHN